MSNIVFPAGQKRKANDPPNSSAAARKKQKFYEARTIPTQTADAALSKNGELNIASFIKSRAREIETLDKSMKKARKELSSRAFQQVPRHLRRRTASHNPKKVPRRLRSRAVREMIVDNTPTVNSKTRKPSSRLRLRLETAKALRKLTQRRKTVRQKKREAKVNRAETDPAEHVDVVRIPRIKKNELASPPLATSKFKRRQVSKTWLPTHIWHTKRAHMTKSTEPLWRMAIPLRPTEKSYRATHRATESRGCVAWDMSYISTIGCKGTENALEKLLKSMSFHGHGWHGLKFSRWKAGSRYAHGWVSGLKNKEPLGLIDVFWCAKEQKHKSDAMDTEDVSGDVDHAGATLETKRQKTRLDSSIMIRSHPSAFCQIWTNLIQAAKLQKPQVLIEDLRFEIGSVEIIGPASMEALTSTLKLSKASENVQKLWQDLSTLSNPALLPRDVLLNLSVQDPRLSRSSKKPAAVGTDASEAVMMELIAAWPLDQKPSVSTLFSFRTRYHAGKLPSQWALSRRRQALLPGETISASTEDPSIPVTLLAHRPSHPRSTQQGSWTLLAPWKCVDVIWRALIYCTLSSGSKPRFGGLRERRQIAFEQFTPWFPGDFPGTDAGKAWERSQAERRFDEWIRRPPSRRTAWQSLDLGLNRRGELGKGWSCDWEYLLKDSDVVTSRHKTGPAKRDMMIEAASSSQPLLTQRQRKAAKAKMNTKEGSEAARRNTSSPEADQGDQSELVEEIQFMQVTGTTAKALIQHLNVSKLPSQPALASIRIQLLTRGAPTNAARIYRLPQIRQAPKSQIPSGGERRNDAGEHLESNSSPAQAQPNFIATNHRSNFNLRAKWLSLDSYGTSCHFSKPMKKDKLNHRGLPRRAEHHAVESLRHINVLPKDAPPEIREQYRPKPLSEEERNVSIARDLAIRMEEQKTWDVHVPCPDAEDLIGFVTTGGYNLAEGKGTAIGAIWMQRVVHGWAAEDKAHFTNIEPSSARTMNKTANARKGMSARQDRERHLCIVRNAGESIGRLGIWELCE